MWEMASKQNFLVCWGSPGRMSSLQVKVNTWTHRNIVTGMAKLGDLLLLLIFVIMEHFKYTDPEKEYIYQFCSHHPASTITSLC